MAPFGKIYSYPGNFRVQRVSFLIISPQLCYEI